MLPENLFPAGLQIRSVAHSIEEMDEQSVFWGLEAEQLGPGKYSGRILGVHSGNLQLARSLRSLGTLLRGYVPKGTVVLSVPVNAPRSIFYRGRLLADSSVIALHHGEEVDFRSAGSLDMLTIAVAEDCLQQHAVALWGEPLNARRCQERSQLPEPAARGRLAGRLSKILETACANATRLTDSGNEKVFEAAVLDAFLCEIADSRKPEQVPTRHRLARRAADFLHAHCHEPLSIAEICAAVGGNRRTLHLGFQELFGVTPIAYLTALRLNRARADLQRPESRDLTITQVAMKWGFFHLGRFSGKFRAHFGVSPSALLR
jgi:AraC family transcriptional regulator, ethanolamine operon transcriptional activator